MKKIYVDIHGFLDIHGCFPFLDIHGIFVQLQFFSGSLPVYLVQCASLARPLGRKERSQRHRFSRFESINSHPHVGDGDNFCWPLWLPPEEQNLFAQVRGPRQIKKKKRVSLAQMMSFYQAWNCLQLPDVFHGLRESIRKIWIAKPWQRPLFHVQEIQVNAFICL